MTTPIPDLDRFLALLFASDERRLLAAAPATDEGWRTELARCEALGAAGLLHAALRRTGRVGSPPTDVQHALRRAHAANAAQNMALEAEAKRVLAALRHAGLVAAPMKGIGLFTEGIVEDLGVRPTGDFDVATRTFERREVLRVLDELGYAARHETVSWKHLPTLTRAGVAVEVHEIAYWSPKTRAVFGASELAVDHRPTRIGRLCALQIHHLVLGSPRDAALLLRTLEDVRAFLRMAAREPDVRRGLVVCAEEAGLVAELGSFDAILSDAGGTPRVLGLHASRRDRSSLLDALQAPPRDPRVESLSHALRILPIQPFALTRDLVSVLAFPPREVFAARDSAAKDSWTVRWRRLRRPFALFYRVAKALPALFERGGRDT